MIDASRASLVLLAAAALAGCASSGSAPRPGSAEAARPPASSSRPTAQNANEVMGRTASSLISLFGQPALDIREGNARKLQFSGTNCVLDTYLYPQRGNAEAIVTHVDARLPDGRDTDKASCMTALRRR